MERWEKHVKFFVTKQIIQILKMRVFKNKFLDYNFILEVKKKSLATKSFNTYYRRRDKKKFWPKIDIPAIVLKN
jgi:hypothetical protein